MRLHVQAYREDLVRRCGDGCHDLEMLHKLIIVQAGRMTRSGVGYSYIHTAVDDHSRLASSESTQMGRKKAECLNRTPLDEWTYARPYRSAAEHR